MFWFRVDGAGMVPQRKNNERVDRRQAEESEIESNRLKKRTGGGRGESANNSTICQGMNEANRQGERNLGFIGSDPSFANELLFWMALFLNLFIHVSSLSANAQVDPSPSSASPSIPKFSAPRLLQGQISADELSGSPLITLQRRLSRPFYPDLSILLPLIPKNDNKDIELLSSAPLRASARLDNALRRTLPVLLPLSVKYGSDDILGAEALREFASLDNLLLRASGNREELRPSLLLPSLALKRNHFSSPLTAMVDSNRNPDLSDELPVYPKPQLPQVGSFHRINDLSSVKRSGQSVEKELLAPITEYKREVQSLTPSKLNNTYPRLQVAFKHTKDDDKLETRPAIEDCTGELKLPARPHAALKPSMNPVASRTGSELLVSASLNPRPDLLGKLAVAEPKSTGSESLVSCKLRKPDDPESALPDADTPSLTSMRAGKQKGSWDSWFATFGKLGDARLVSALSRCGNPAGANSVSVTVLQNHQVKVTLIKPSQADFDRATIKAYQSLSGNPELAFPKGSGLHEISFVVDNSHEASGEITGIKGRRITDFKEDR
jgi:hypothetical protein